MDICPGKVILFSDNCVLLGYFHDVFRYGNVRTAFSRVKLTFIGHSGSSRSAFYLYRTTVWA